MNNKKLSIDSRQEVIGRKLKIKEFISIQGGNMHGPIRPLSLSQSNDALTKK